MKTTMRWIIPLLFLTACDPESNEIGATVGDEDSSSASGGEQTSDDDSSGGDPTEGMSVEACDPFDGCPDTPETSQECEPTASGESWACVPQFAGTSPGYGDDCWPEDSPTVACTGPTICLPAEGLGVTGCDGGEGGGCCTQLCDLSLNGGIPCPDEGQICAPFYGDAQPPEGYEHVGVCQLQ